VGSIRSPETRKKYLQRMGYFFNYLNIPPHSPEERFQILTQKAEADLNRLINALFKYIQSHRARVDKKEISGATIRIYVKPIRLYCHQMDIPISWKKLMRGMPKGKRYANDRAPTIEEIKQISPILIF
jgi:hypothetical protein